MLATASSSAKEFPERSKYTAGESCCFVRQTLELLSKRPLLAAVHLAGSSRHFVGRQIDVVCCPGGHAARGGQLVRNRTDRGVLDRHGRLQQLGWIMLCRLVHHLCPDWQRECGAVAA